MKRNNMQCQEYERRKTCSRLVNFNKIFVIKIMIVAVMVLNLSFLANFTLKFILYHLQSQTFNLVAVRPFDY